MSGSISLFSCWCVPARIVVGVFLLGLIKVLWCSLTVRVPRVVFDLVALGQVGSLTA